MQKTGMIKGVLCIMIEGFQGFRIEKIEGIEEID
jgi:hypothetical protein